MRRSMLWQAYRLTYMNGQGYKGIRYKGRVCNLIGNQPGVF